LPAVGDLAASAAPLPLLAAIAASWAGGGSRIPPRTVRGHNDLPRPWRRRAFPRRVMSGGEARSSWVPVSRCALADGADHAEAGCPRCARQRSTVGALISRASDAVLPKQPLECFCCHPTVTAPDRALLWRAFRDRAARCLAHSATRSICLMTHGKTHATRLGSAARKAGSHLRSPRRSSWCGARCADPGGQHQGGVTAALAHIP